MGDNSAMASHGGHMGNISLPSLSVTRTLADLNFNTTTTKSIFFTGVAVLVFLVTTSNYSRKTTKNEDDNEDEGNPSSLKSLLLFCYSCFIKPHATAGTTGTQQDALESFYRSQADIYDATRGTLLKGREDMLALAASQLRYKVEAGLGGLGGAGDGLEKRQRNGKTCVTVAGTGTGTRRKPIWVDVGGGTGWNIEAMAKFVNVSEFFKTVYLVDFSPSLCEVARKRFARLGWENVRVICTDARKFRLEDYEDVDEGESGSGDSSPSLSGWWGETKPGRHAGAELITMSYSLSMMPDYFSIIDSLESLLAPHGLIAVVDFYAQSKVDFTFRNYTGGLMNRHVGYFARNFWRSWFDADRVSLEPARRDYLEYRFGTVLTVNARNNTLGAIPYYIWLGCLKKPFSTSSLPHEIVEHIDAIATESPRSSPRLVGKHSSSATNALAFAVGRTAPEMRSKAFNTAIENISANLPLPSFFYQNHHWRIYYDDQLPKHTQFNDEYIYAFTWEDSRVDRELLNLGPDDVVLAITSAGDNILSYLMQSPARVHAIDLNPAQNHLLELKVASFTTLDYPDVWKIFGEGKHPDFRSLLISKLSPHLSGRAFQYWLSNAHIFTDPAGRGLYDTGGSRYAIRFFRWISTLFFCRSAVRRLLSTPTLEGQRSIYHTKIRPCLLNRFVNGLVLSSDAFLWSALGVPKNQVAMIEADYHRRSISSSTTPSSKEKPSRAEAILHYTTSTLDPVLSTSHLASDNPYYLVCVLGQYTRQCHPDYLSPAAHSILSAPGAFDGLRIHTDEIQEVLARFQPGTLTVAVVMDSMDWFDPPSPEEEKEGRGKAREQVRRLNRALKVGGKVLLRSAGVEPWYVRVFVEEGFGARRVGCRESGRGDQECIDRVNMYASCWILEKMEDLEELVDSA
ncbi:hypothetical protein GE21DRAFT_2268 [Neurospora crassa]|uniref:Betaine lipid synthase n=2 Tax=Neurospora crassa TaxID=5141 RepID=Q7SGY5_NEUCR|nr:betaine lipid synthase [Neurospora crassa OR74A]EAA36182.1 betaine lipid synthase [Neurospora crassa OR74A]KHE89185.1 hypothetical protein GE21DRAFT_2268 [Neurospora crassa]CAE76263.1 related to S-adenosylmethionine:diacylglycerol 3-amino-3-carboxypropyl transferase btaA [Neurospora crassa]|eukprot:XP_965418.1 betaine lipid synthase [Neurospora crassa OR74A]